MRSVSVVIPVHNGAAFVADAVRSALGQDVPVLECIVVDDGSTDGTADAVSAVDDARVRYVHQERSGVSAARNAGIAAAAGDVVAFLDADDVWRPDKLAKQLELLERTPDAGCVYCGYAIVGSDLAERVRVPAGDLDLRRWLLLDGNGILFPSTAIVPRAVLEAVGGFDTRLSTTADLDMALRIADEHQVVAVDDVLVGYRLHGAQMHRDMSAYERDRVRVLAERLGAAPHDHARATANLHTRLFFHELAARRAGRAVRHLPRIGRRVDRLVALPVEAGARRVARRWRSRTTAGQSWRPR